MVDAIVDRDGDALEVLGLSAGVPAPPEIRRPDALRAAIEGTDVDR